MNTLSDGGFIFIHLESPSIPAVICFRTTGYGADWTYGGRDGETD